MKNDTEFLGGRIRKLRKLAGLRLKVLAERVGCSESMLSKIENGKGNPSLNLLHRITGELGISIGHLFSAEESGGPVMRQGERPLIVLTGPRRGVTLEALMPRQGGHILQAHIHIVAPGGGVDATISHEGEEVGYVLTGSLILEIDGVQHTLRQGDAFFFSSPLPHRYTNPGQETTQVLWVNTPPTF